MTVDGTRLSPAGVTRRDAMRDELLRDVVRVHVGRRRRRRGVAALLLVGAGVAIALAMPRPGPTVPVEQIAERETPPAAPAPRVRFTRVETNPSLIDRYRVKSAPSRVVRIDDAELAAFLASTGRPSGVVRVGDEVRLAGHVVDPPRRDGRTPDRDQRDVPTL